MTLTQLSYVVAVSQHRNFAAAAESTFVTQPTLSMQIQKLEDELGVILFDRGQQPVKPTPLGEQVIAQAKIILAEAQKLHELVSKEKAEITGELRLGIIPTLAPYLLPRFINNLVKSYPQLNVIVEEVQTGQILSRLREGSLDVGLLVTPLQQKDVIEHVLFYEPFLLYISPTHPLIDAKKVKEKDLSSKEVWLLNEGHCFRDQVINLCREGGKRRAVHNGLRFESGNLETLKKMVDQGQGFTFLPQLATEDLPETKRKKQVREFEAPVPTREVSLVHSHVYRKEAIVQAVSQEIRKALPNDLQQLKKGTFHRVDMLPFK